MGRVNDYEPYDDVYWPTKVFFAPDCVADALYSHARLGVDPGIADIRVTDYRGRVLWQYSSAPRAISGELAEVIGLSRAIHMAHWQRGGYVYTESRVAYKWLTRGGSRDSRLNRDYKAVRAIAQEGRGFARNSSQIRLWHRWKNGRGIPAAYGISHLLIPTLTERTRDASSPK